MSTKIGEFIEQCQKHGFPVRCVEEGELTVEAVVGVESTIEKARIEGAPGHPARLVADMIVRSTLQALGDKFGREMMEALIDEYSARVKANSIVLATRVPV